MDENRHSGPDLPEYFTEHGTLFCIRAGCGSRVFKTPMGRHWLPWPYRADFAGGGVAYGDDEVHFWHVGGGKLIPVFAAQVFQRVSGFADFFNGKGIDGANGMAAGAKAAEAALA